MKKRRERGDRMYDPILLEDWYRRFSQDVKSFLPEGMIQIDIDLLQELDLLHLEKKPDSALTRFFHVVDSTEKVTLINDQFIIWIVPENVGHQQKTNVYIAINDEGIPRLELGFTTTDVYNSSRFVLRILEKFLFEIQENEEIIKHYKG